MNMDILTDDLQALSHVYKVGLGTYEGKDYVMVYGFNLPPGYNCSEIPLLIALPDHYPEQAIGVGKSAVYVPSTLRYKGRQPTDFHPQCGPTSDWSWWCYERVHWCPQTDSIISFLELLRAHMTNPPTK